MFDQWPGHHAIVLLTLAQGAGGSPVPHAAISAPVFTGCAMNFFCLIETEGSQVPYLQYLPVSSLEDARTHVRRLLTEHTRPLSARIFAGEESLDTLMPCGTSTRQRGPWSADVPAGCSPECETCSGPPDLAVRPACAAQPQGFFSPLR